MSDKVVLYPSPVLRKKCKKVTLFDSIIRSIIDSMFVKLKEFRGIGLSAPQIGLEQRFFVCNITGKAEDNMVFINPEIIERRRWTEDVERCLSLPNVEVSCKRSKICRIKAFDVNDKEFEIETEGLLARMIQHECDHLDGCLIIDKMDDIDKIRNKKFIRFLERDASSKGISG